MLSHFPLISFIVFQTYAVIVLELYLFETEKQSFSGDCTADCHFVCSGILTNFLALLVASPTVKILAVKLVSA